MNKSIELGLNTSLCAICVCDTYNMFDYDFFCNGVNQHESFYELEYNRDEMEQGFESALNDIWACDEIKNVLANLGLEFDKAEGLWSPRCYNYQTDNVGLNFKSTAEFSKEKVAAWIDELAKKKECVDYLYKHYSSCSGFWSMTSNNFDDLRTKVLDYFEKGDINDRDWAALIMVSLFAAGINEETYQYEFINCVAEQCLPYDEKLLITEELYELYENTEKVEDLCRKIADNLGIEEFEFNKYYENHPDDEAGSFILWAFENNYSVADLEKMAIA